MTEEPRDLISCQDGLISMFADIFGTLHEEYDAKIA